MTWTEPATNGAAITGYDIEYRIEDADLNSTDKQPGLWVSHAHTGTGTDATIGSLTNGTTYQVRVRAENSFGEGQWSLLANEVPAGTPAAPGTLTVATRHQRLAVSWAAPADNGAGITGYNVQYRACTATPKTCTTNPTWDTWTSHTHSGTGTTTTIGSLTNGTTYQIQVQATNGVGDSDWSDAAEGTPAASTPGAPSASGRAVAQGYKVSWTAPANNGEPITGYEVRYRVENDAGTWPTTWTFYAATDAATYTITISLSNSGSAAAQQAFAETNTPEIQAQVRALNNVGKGGWSAQPPDAPAAPQVASVGAGLTATWTAPASNGAPVTGYGVRYRIKDTNQNQPGDQPGSWTALTGNADPGTNTTATITGLTNGTAYQVQVRATNSAGHGGWSPSAAGTPAARKPARPSAPVVTAKSQGLDVSWTAPASNGAAITDYDVQYRQCTATDGDSSVKTCVTNPTWETNWTDRSGETSTDTATTVAITGLDDGTAHQVRVRAANSVGESAWSPTSKGTPTTGGTADPQPPDAPAAPKVDALNQSLRVSWEAPAINGSAVTGYSVRFRLTDTDQDQTGNQPGNWTYQGHTDTSTHTVIESLANGVNYQVQVLARSVAGDSDWSSSTAATPAAQKPDQPVAPTVIVWNRSLRPSWAAPASNGAAVTDFDLQWRACTATDKTCASSPAWGSWTDRGGETTPDTSTSATITGLTNGTAYQVQVRAANSVGESGWSLSTTAIPVAQRPEAPAKPIVAPWHRSLRTSWTAPTDNGATVTDYDLQYRACTANDKTCATNPTWGAWTNRSGETASDAATTGTITGLTNGTAHQVRLRAANSVGESTWSQPSAKGVPAVQKPDAPAAPTLSYGNQSLGVSWTAPTDNGATISDYDVRYRACTATPKTCTSSPTWGDWASHTHTGAGTTATISSLTNGTGYQVQVRATNSVGDSAWSTSASEYPSTTPGTPAAPTLTVKDQSLGVSWSAPSGNGGSAITGYKVGRCSTGCGTDSNWTVATLTGTGTTTTLSSLTNGTAYQVRVAATNRSGDSAWSTTSTATPARAPDKPDAPSVTVWNKSLNVSWTAPADNGADITDYDVQYRACTATPKTCTSSPTWGNWASHSHTGTGTTATIGSLTNDTAYQIQVQATNNIGDSAWSNSATATPTAQKPDAPASPTLSYGNQSLGVSWTAPTDNGADITDYDVRHRACTATPKTCTSSPTWGNWASHTHTGTGTTATIGSLTNGTAYQVQVRAANSVGDGAWSASASEYPSTVPDAPAAPTLTANDESLGVSWSAPSGNGGSAVTGYKVGRCSSGCGTDSNWTVATLTGTGTTTTLSSLTNGTAYQVRVAATNRSGDSTWSASATATPAGVPDTPAAPTLTVWNKSLNLSWTAPDDNGADITDYDVRYRACTNSNDLTCATNPTWGNWASHTHTGTATTATITGLTNDTAYQVQIRATNSAGDSAWSTSTKAAPTAQKPDAPAAPTLTYGDQSLAASWTAPTDNGADITDYDVRYRACTATPKTCTSSPTWGDWASHTHTGTGTTATISSLTNGTAYQVQVRAANSAGDSAWSTSASEYPSTVPDAPAAPTLTVQDQSLDVSWSAPSGNGGSAVTGYKVGRCSTNCGTGTNWTVTILNSTGTTTTLSSLTNDTAYQVRVAATNRSGDSAWSTSATATPAGVPDTPSAATLTKGAEQLGVSWTAPDDNGADITDYDVRYRACTNSNDLTCATNPAWGDWATHTHTGTGTTATIGSLTNGTAYQVQVRATNSAGDSGWSASAEAAPEDKPAQPAAPTLTYGDQRLGVSWTAPTDNGQAISGYGVQYRACTATPKTCTSSPTWGDWASHTHTGTGTTASITGLTNGTAYQVQVRATNSVGDSAWSNSASEYPSTVPGAPTAVTLTAKDQSLDVSWTAPSGNGGSAVTGYKIGRCSANCGTDSNWTVTILNSTGTTTTLSSLTNGTAYQVRVAATNRSGDSVWSTSATATPAGVPDRPAAPTLTVWNKSLNLSWTAPDDNGADITDYDVRYRACTATPKTCTSSPTWGDWASHTHTGTGTTTTIGSLTNGTAYQVQVRATNSAGDSAWSTSTKATPAAQKPEAPAAPTLTYGDQSLAASWTAPADNGADISGYDVQYRACTATPKTCTSSPTWGDWASHTHTGTGTTATISTLTNGTAYQVQVRATNSVGDSAWSTSASEYPSTVPDAPAAPTLTVNDQSLGVSWSAPSGDGGSAVTGYKVGRCSTGCGTDSNWTVATLTGTGTTTTLSSLTNGTAYQVRVAATNRSGDSNWSASSTATPARAPDTPTAPTLTVWNKSLNLSWTEPADNGADITDYDVRYRACTNSNDLTCATNPTWGDWASHTHTGTGTTASITGLTNGTAYQVQIRAANSVGNSAWSTSTKATPAAQKPDAPAAPALTVGNQRLALSWTEPADNGAAISDYDVRYRACTNSNDLTCATNPTWGNWASHTHTGTGTTASITGLTNGTAYQVQVRATNSAGDSAWSTAAKAAPAPQPPDQPAAPSASARHQGLAVSWTAPTVNGADITGYNVRYRACTATPLSCTTSPTWGDWASHTHTGTGTTASITGLTNGTAYQVQVQAKSAAGNSAWSVSAKQTPAIQAPDTPAAPTLTAKHQSLAVSWTAPTDNGSAITGYGVQYRACTATPLSCATSPTWGDWASHTHTGTGTTASITGLTNGTAYQVQIRAANSVGNSAWSVSAKQTPAIQAPDAPAAPTLTAKHQSLAVSWTAPADNGSTIRSYDVRHRACTATPKTCTTSPTWGDWASQTHTGTTASITGLTNGTAYQVQVRATNSVGDSAWSTSTTAAPAAQKPSTPVAPTLTHGDQSLAASWTAPADNGATITGYDVQYRACTATPLSCATSPTWGDWASHTHTGTGTTASITGLTNGTAYQVQIRAANSVGNSAWSDSTKATPSTVPGVPTVTLSGVSASRTTSRISWSLADDGGATITGYEIDWRCHPGNGWASSRAGVSPWSVSANLSSRDSSIAECSSKLGPNQEYRFRVRAGNANGWSVYSSPFVKTTPPSVSASAVSIVLAGTQMTVSWTASDGGLKISDHDVRYRQKDTDSVTPGDQPGSWTTLSGADDPGTSTTATITGLTVNTVYQVQVRATNEMDAGSWSDSLDWPQPPSPPDPVTVTAKNLALGVSWTEPAANGSPVTDYDVQYRACTATPLSCATSPTWGAWQNRTGETATDTATSLSITGLTNGTAYQIRVRAANSIGESSWSASGQAIPAKQPPDAPAAPILTVSRTSLGVSWTEPADNNGSAVTDYDVQYRACTATPLSCATSPAWGDWTEWNASNTSTTTSATITGLTQGTAYQVRVRAANSIGDGDWSGSTTGIPAAAPSAPGAPTLTVRNQSLAASWSAPANGGSAITDYDVQYRACTATPLTCTSSPTWGSWNNRSGETSADTATEARITGLTNGTAYQARVRAANLAGDGAWSSASAKAVPALSKPDPPDAPTLTVKHQSLGVSWSAPDNGGSAITDYDVRYRACTATPKTCTSSPTWGAWADRTGETASDTGTTVTVAGLTNGTAYQVQVRAANSIGDSAWSAGSKAIPAPTAPDAPAAPDASYRHTALYVTYAEPATNGAAITDYDVRYRACTNSSDLTCASDPTWGDWTDRTGETASDTGTTVTVSGLTNGTAYQVQVRAANSIGESGWSASGQGTPTPKPATPTGLSVTTGHESWTASWTAPSGPVVKYQIDHAKWSTLGGGYWQTPKTGNTQGRHSTSFSRSGVLAGLRNGDRYRVRVAAQNLSGWSALSGWVEFTVIAPPPVPTNVSLTVKDESLAVSWTSPSNDSGSAISDYDVQYRACTATPLTCASSPTWGSWTEWNADDTSTTTSATITGLTNGTAYQVQARSTNAAHDSAWSATATATPADEPDAPSAPTVTAKHQSLAVSWTAPDDNGRAITDYDVQYQACTATPKTCTTSPTWGSWTEWNASDTSTTTSATITGLTNDTAYQVQVRAANSIGDGAWSSSTKATPTAQPPDAPGAPTVTVWNKELRLSWTPPAINGSAINDYDVRYRACTATPLTCASSPTWGAWTEWNASNTSTTTSATITGLTNDTAYQVQVRAGSSAGDGTWSSSTKATPTAQPPEAPGAPTLSHGNASLSASWTEPTANGAAITDYDVQYRACTATPKTCTSSPTWGSWTEWNADDTSTTTSATITGLTNGTAYQVQVRAANSAGDGAWSASSASEYPSTVPTAPAAPTLTFGSQSLSVSWSAPADGGAAISDYDVQYRACTATPKTCTSSPTWGSWTEWNADDTSTTTSATITGLTNGTAYQVQARASNRSGDSPWSGSATETPAHKPASPAKPTVTRGNARIAVSWTAPSDGGAAISDYNVNYREHNRPAVNHPFTGTGTTTTITGLTNGKRYQVAVQAVNKAGGGNWSPWSSLVTPANAPSAPSAPTLTHGAASLGVSWTAPADNGDAITDYDVQYRACTATPKTCTTNPTWGSWSSHTHTGTGTTATISSLTNGTAYQVQVRASNSVGAGSWSASAKEHPSTVPGAPAAPTLSVWHASLTATWTAPTADGGSAVTGYSVQYRACTATPRTCATSPTWGSWSSHTHTGTGTTATITGLTNGTAYQVQIAAKNRSGTGAWSSSASAIPAAQTPAAPAAPALTVKNQALGVSWTAPDENGSAITDYDVQYQACTATDKTCKTSPSWGDWTDRSGETTGDTSTTAELTGLTNGTAYRVRVRAANARGESDWSPLSTATPATTPGAPGTPTVTAGAAQLSVSWSAPSSDGGAAVTGYKVQHCDQSTGCDADDEWTTNTHTGTGTTATIHNLTNGTTYRVRVAATNSVGDSAWSSYRTGKPKDKPAQPGAPTVVSGNASLSVKWTAPADNGSAITGYKVRYCGGDTADCSNDDSTDWKEKSSSSTSTTISSLVNGTSYQVKVRARNAVGDSDWSSETEGTPGAPAAPSRPSLTEGDSQLTASWTQPSNRGDAITAYGVEYCDSTNDCTDDSNWTDDSPFDTSTSHTITGLTNGTTYKVRVRAQNARGWGGWSSEATATPATVPGAPDAPTLTAKSQALDVTWTAPSQTGGSAITGYAVRYCDNSTGCDATNEWTVRTVSSGSTTSYTITGLTNGKSYEVQVAARNRKGLSDYSTSATATPAALPSKPTSLTVESAHQSLKVTWTASVDNGSTITGYEVEYRKQNSDNTWPPTWTSHSHSDTSTYTTIDSLTNGSNYQVRVQATSNNGNSGWTSAVTGTPKAVPDAPDAPTLTAGDRKIDLSWSEPNNNGSAVTDYDVRYRKQNSDSSWPSSWTSLSHTGTATTAAMTSLTNGSAYQVQVRAENANGEGPWSTASTATPAGKPLGPSTPTLTAGDQQLTVTWTAPSDNGSAITSYSVQHCDSANDCTDDSNWTDDSPSGTTTSHTITGLTNGTAYKVRVRATNNVGDGPWSTSATGTPAGAPSAPENLAFASGNGYLTVSWTTASNGSTISGHQVRHCNTSDSSKDCYSDYDDWTTVSVSGTATSKKITGLTNGDYYNMEVRANSNQGYSGWSSSSSGVPGAPAKPTISTITAGDDQFTVTWTAPASNGDDIQYYDVGYCNETNGDCAAGTWYEEYHSDTSTRSLNVSGLEDASKYKVRVRAANGRGAGEWSTISTVTTT